LDCSVAGRSWSSLDTADLILITYGTLRLDIEYLSKISFSYVVLDESQAIKNENSQTAKASYILQADHRLAMSGTPIENHVGELRSLLRFLNPGLIDQGLWSKVLQKNADLHVAHTRFLRKALRPLILRRKKSDVLQDLPPKVEHNLYCDMETDQRVLYDELRDHYRRHLTPESQDDSWQRSPLNMIEALLRLRQAACHPALISAVHDGVSSAKMEVLIEKLRELHESGHKALVFSQFTSFLKLVAKRLQDEQLPFEYLDGQTRDRSGRVSRFQNDPSISFFLISMKAGGVGLNLTAADYCFILDPWWNPAVEEQAIDRAHRIHQQKTVFAYRLIVKDSVEEKIQQMQADKSELAASILATDGSPGKNLDLKALRSLFS
jgi:SNF2 family DNA or RNA helicase